MSAPSSEVKGPPKITIDGKVIEIKPGQTIMQAAESAGIDAGIPRFCYHPGLPIAGTCRMCTVEVEKAPKLMTSCSTPAADGMIVHTQSERVRKSRKGVMEFLLINHPLDCPVCDQAGECDLQDYDYEYGPGTSRFQEDKRIWAKATTKKLSDEITLNMNRCVHCERCVRFTESVSRTNDLFMINRGWKKQLVTPEDVGLKGEYQGCLADICPVGALTFNDFRFKKRVWFLTKSNSICDGCSKGCNIITEHEKGRIHRMRPRYNAEVNGHWMCDEGRKTYHTFMNPERLVAPLLGSSGGMNLNACTWDVALKGFSEECAKAQSILFVLGTDLTMEEATSITKGAAQLTSGSVQFAYYNGVNGVQTSGDDAPLDNLLRRKDKTPNTKGLESLKIKPLGKVEKPFDLVVHVRFGRAALAPKGLGKREWAWGLFSLNEVDGPETKNRFCGFFPGQSTAEKNGTFVNCDGKVQRFVAGLGSVGESRSVDFVLQSLERQKFAKQLMREKTLS